MALRLGWRLLLIVISAIAIAYSIYSYLDSLQQTVKVVVAAEDIPAHTEITTDKLRLVEIEINAANTILKRPTDDMSALAGGIALKEIKKDQPVELNPELLIFPEQRHLYLRANGQVDVTYFIPKDRRLLTVALDPQGSINNTLEKGDWVDIIFSTKNETTNSSAKMILQQVEVFDIEHLQLDRGMTSKAGVVQHVTLLVTPQEAVVLTLAKRQGNIDLILNPWNGEKENVIPVKEDSLH
ncbi:Flp pilus assembly protein CpaB [Halalkalibacter alkalisediminis]|uniref:Flp pilus assembly protein CpaB n=1 Tax=Halalkalibacter alkalisediminis TaxID=935616 RepID=A0ABV6NKE5_9BACI|nr:Flp pilus assembly protein CpaB [Halalkalibacter alkalisediminis]